MEDFTDIKLTDSPKRVNQSKCDKTCSKKPPERTIQHVFKNMKPKEKYAIVGKCIKNGSPKKIVDHLSSNSLKGLSEAFEILSRPQADKWANKEFGTPLSDSLDCVTREIEKEIESRLMNMTNSEMQGIDEINKEISTRSAYGMRTVISPGKKATRCSWSNESASWYCRSPWHSKGEEETIDANEIIVDVPLETVEKFNFLLQELPLYRYSFEAKTRGEVDWEQATRDWIKKQLELKDLEGMV